jgi:hypothetical protein
LQGLAEHSGVEIIASDRSSEYTRAIQQAAPFRRLSIPEDWDAAVFRSPAPIEIPEIDPGIDPEIIRFS